MGLELNDAACWQLLVDLFLADNPLTKSQYVDKLSPNKFNSGETRLWVAVLQTVYEDVMAYKTAPSKNTLKCVKDLPNWFFKDSSLVLDLMCQSVGLVLSIDSDVIKERLRKWLIAELLSADIKPTPVYNGVVNEPLFCEEEKKCLK